MDDAIVGLLHFFEMQVQLMEQFLRGREPSQLWLQASCARAVPSSSRWTGSVCVWRSSRNCSRCSRWRKNSYAEASFAYSASDRRFLSRSAGEREHGSAMANPRFAAAVQPLKALDQKLDIADSAAREFDVEARIARPALRFFVNALAGSGYGFNGREIQRRLIDPRLDGIEQLAAGRELARGDASLDQHLQFPVAAARFVVGLRAVERKANFPEPSIGP